MDCFGTYFTHVQTCDVARVQSAGSQKVGAPFAGSHWEAPVIINDFWATIGNRPEIVFYYAINIIKTVQMSNWNLAATDGGTGRFPTVGLFFVIPKPFIIIIKLTCA